MALLFLSVYHLTAIFAMHAMNEGKKVNSKAKFDYVMTKYEKISNCKFSTM